MRRVTEADFWKRVQKGAADECWLWTGNPNRKGYGVATWDGASRHAHRVALLLQGVEIPTGMVVDHLCKTRLCVNPAHLRVADYYTNSVINSVGPVAVNAMKTHCLRGHPLSGENLRTNSLNRGWRGCRTCDRMLSREREKSPEIRERKNAYKRAWSARKKLAGKDI